MNMEELNEFIDKKIEECNLSTDETAEVVKLLRQQEKIASAIAVHKRAIGELSREGVNISKKVLRIAGFSEEDLQKIKEEVKESAKAATAKECNLDPAVAEEIDAILKKHGVVPADAVIIGATQVKTEEKEDGSED